MRKVLSILLFTLLSIQIYCQSKTDSVSVALHLAVYNNDLDSVIKLLQNKHNPNAADGNGTTPLAYAVQNNNVEITNVLLDRGANINLRSGPKKRSPLHIACFNGNFEAAENLCFKSAVIDTGDYYGLTPLHYAVFNGDYFMTDMLLFYGANPNKANTDGNTPLHLAALHNDTGIVSLLLSKGANPNLLNLSGLSPLMIAITGNQTNVYSALIEYDSISFNDKKVEFIALLRSIAVGNDSLTKVLSSREVIYSKVGLQNPYLYAKALGQLKTAKYLKDNGYAPGFNPYITAITFSYGLIANSNDLFFNHRVGIDEAISNMSFSLGWKSRYTRKAVHVDLGDEYQLWERRNSLDLKATKYFFISAINPIQPFVSLAMQVDLGKYYGMNFNIMNKFNIVPEAGICYNNMDYRVELAASYLKLDYIGYKPLFFNMNFILKFANYSLPQDYYPEYF